MAVKYFLYSDEQIKEKNKILAQTGKKFVPGTVAVGAKRYKFTQISNTPNLPRFADTKVVTFGEESDITYIAPKSETKRGN